MKILLADSDVDTLDVTTYSLRREGFVVITATSGPDALQLWQTEQPHMLLLAAGLTQINGMEVCHRIRQREDTPVIVMSERTDDEHVVQAFRLGADDFVARPFSPRQLVMRIRALWRRRGPTSVPEPQRELRVGSLLLDVDSHEVSRGERVIHLTPTEFRLLHILAINAGRVVSGARLVEFAWGYDESDVLLLKTHICHIRRKLSLARGRPGDIVSIPGVGYRLTLEESAQTGEVHRSYEAALESELRSIPARTVASSAAVPVFAAA